MVHIIFTNAGVKVSGAAKYRPQQIQIIIISGTCSDCSYAFLMLPLITLHWSSLLSPAAAACGIYQKDSHTFTRNVHLFLSSTNKVEHSLNTKLHRYLAQLNA